MTLERRIDNILTEIGISPELLGYEALATGIKLLYLREEDYSKVTKTLYPRIAEEIGHGQNAIKVERRMRHAIERGFDNADPDTIYKYFGNSISRYRDRPTVSAFLFRIALNMKLEDKENV